MADFWGGFGQGFSDQFGASWDRAEKRRILEDAAKLAKEERVATATAQAAALKGYGEDPLKTLTGAPEYIWQKPFEDVVAQQDRTKQLAFTAGAPLALKRLQAEKKVRENDLENMGRSWTNLSTGNTIIPDDVAGTLSDEDLESVKRGGRAVWRETQEPKQMERARNFSEAISTLNNIERITGRADRDWDNLPDEAFDIWTSDKGLEDLKNLQATVQKYIEVFNETPSDFFDNGRITELSRALETNRKAIGSVAKGSDAYKEIVKETDKIRKELGKEESRKTFNIPQMEEKIRKRLAYEKSEEDWEKETFSANQSAARKRVSKFTELYVPRQFEENMVPLVQGEKDGDKVKLWKQVYLERKVHPTDDRKWYWDVRDSFRGWNTEYRDIIPNFVGREGSKTNFVMLSPPAIPRSIIYRRDTKFVGIDPDGLSADERVDYKKAKKARPLGSDKRPPENPEEITPAQQTEREERWAKYGWSKDGTRTEEFKGSENTRPDSKVDLRQVPSVTPQRPVAPEPVVEEVVPEVEVPEVIPEVVPEPSPFSEVVPSEAGDEIIETLKYPPPFEEPIGPLPREESFIGITEKARAGDALAKATLRKAVEMLTPEEQKRIAGDERLKMLEIGFRRLMEK